MKFFEKYGVSRSVQFLVGVLILALMIILGASLWPDAEAPRLMFRMFVGLSIGYALSRAAMGFAGTVNRAYTTGSTKLMKAIAVLFIFGGIATFVAVMGGVLTPDKLPGNTLNWGLLIGATLFGFGMSFGVCCASGVLTDLADSPLRALVVLFFFCMGGFLGVALVNQDWMKWYAEPIFGLEALGNKANLNFATWFNWDGTNGALGALILTIILASVVIFLATLYENKRKRENTYLGCECECCIAKIQTEPKENETLGYKIISKPWGMLTGAAVIALAFAALLFVTKGGWGVSGPLGQWFARFLHMFGLSGEAIESFTNGGYKAGMVDAKFFTNQMYVQDLSIFAGAIIYLLTSGNFWKPKAWLFKPLEIVFFAFGGILLGLAINLAKGCNAGGLFTPISSFATSGWIYLICIVGGGFLGNIVRKYLYKVCKLS